MVTATIQQPQQPPISNCNSHNPMTATATIQQLQKPQSMTATTTIQQLQQPTINQQEHNSCTHNSLQPTAIPFQLKGHNCDYGIIVGCDIVISCGMLRWLWCFVDFAAAFAVLEDTFFVKDTFQSIDPSIHQSVDRSICKNLISWYY